MTKDETLGNLYKAKEIIYDASSCWEKIRNIKSQYMDHRAGYSYSVYTMSRPLKILFAVAIIAVIFTAISFIMSIANFGAGALIGGVIPLIAAIIFLVVIIKLRNKYIDSKNRKVGEQNEAIDRKNAELANVENEIRTELSNIQTRYNEEVGSWYPPDYAFPDAVDFFISSIQNSRADNLKEAVNTYEQDLHRRRLEAQNEQNLANQKVMQQQLEAIDESQRIGNELAKGQLLVQGMTYLGLFYN